MSGHAELSGTLGPGLVAVIAYDGLCTFEFGIAVEVFGLPRPEFDFAWYDFRVVSADGARLRAAGGIVVEATPDLSILERARTIVVPGWRDRGERPPDQLLEAVSRASEGGARCLSICSGVFVLAAAGLLDGRRATTHWRHVPDFKRMYPDIQVEEDVLYVDEGSVITSAGSAAGIDACIHLVRRDFGGQGRKQCGAPPDSAPSSRRRSGTVHRRTDSGASWPKDEQGTGLGTRTPRSTPGSQTPRRQSRNERTNAAAQVSGESLALRPANGCSASVCTGLANSSSRAMTVLTT